jgi:2,3-bisphosphoglycerate-independent phosphoglycerate mutase
MSSRDGRVIIFLGDGMGGRSVPSLGGRTCLEAANTLALDTLARYGSSGLMYVAGAGQPIGSDTAHMALLGYDPFTQYRGRGPFEAKGVGLEMLPGDVAFRCNFATVDEKGIITDRRAGRIKSGTDKLAAAIMNACKNGIEGVEVFFKASVEHRAALVLRGDNLDYRVTDVDPHDTGTKPARCEPRADVPGEAREAAERTARIVNEFVQIAQQVLDQEDVNKERRAANLPPANVVLPRGAGEAVDLPPFSAVNGGLSGAMVVEVDLVRGLGLYAQMEVIPVDGATGGMDTDEIAIARAVADNISRYDLILCNIKAPDIGGHDGDAQAKIRAIEKVDRAVAYLLDTINWGNTTIMVGADHCTPVSYRDHTGDAVPVVFFGNGVRSDAVDNYCERTAGMGGIGRIAGSEVIMLLRNFAGRIEKHGA